MRKSAVISLRLAKSNLHALLARLCYSTRIETLNIQKELGCHTLRAMTTSSSSWPVSKVRSRTCQVPAN